MNILGLDYGKKRIGLAWVDTAINVVLPYGIVEAGVSAVAELARLIDDEKIDAVIIGLPLGLDSKENENTAVVRAFSTELGDAVRAQVFFVDERFTSQEADSTHGDVSRDEKSAMIILQTYVDRHTDV